jgi:thymidylate synthase
MNDDVPFYNRHDSVYHSLLKKILHVGVRRKNRTGVDTIGIFGEQIEFDLKDTFPALTTKRMAWRAIVSELIWFLHGDQDERSLASLVHGIQFGDQQQLEDSFATHRTIWTDNVEADYWVNRNKQMYVGDAGRIYGVQWRFWETFRNGQVETVDQIDNLIEGLKKDPYGRRHIISAWNPGELDNMCLPPCHILAQFNVTNDGYLECMMFQRSVDTFLGLPFNIASYALLTYIIAAVTGLKPGRLIMSLGDVHIYENHVDQVKEQLQREYRAEPKLIIPSFDKGLPVWLPMYPNEFVLVNYNPHPSIKAPMAV